MSQELRSLVLRASASGLRTAQFDEKDHIVVPVVALVEGVVHAVNAANPELVLASEFSRFPSGWNGEPVMFNHPVVNGKPVSANDPSVLAMYQIGRVFNTQVDQNMLRMEAWLDPERVKKVGINADDLLKRLEQGGKVEVSVGVFVNSEKKVGHYNGKQYKSIWRNMVPDHLAFLQLGDTGACSNEAGCGAGAGMVHLITAEGISLEDQMGEKNKEQKDPSLREQLLSLLGISSEEQTEEKEDEKPPVTVEAQPTCGCKNKDQKDKSAPRAAEGKEDVMHKNAERITALIANPKTGWKEADRAFLETTSDAQLATLEASAADPVPAPKAEIKFEDLTPEWQQAITEQKNIRAAKQAKLVGELKTAQNVFNEDELKNMPIDQLEKIATLASVQIPVDYSGAAGSRTPEVKTASEGSYAPKPRGLFAKKQ